MKNVIARTAFLVIAALALAACGGGNQGTVKNVSGSKKKSVFTPQSSGMPYEMMVVSQPADYQNGAYDALFEILNDDIPGLPQPEAHFKISRLTHENFTRTFRYCRNVIIMNIDHMYTSCKFKFSRDVYASPQIVMTIQAPDAQSFIRFVKDNAGSLISFFTRVEMNREADNLQKEHNIPVEQKIKELFDCDIWIPQELNKTKVGKNFFWASTDNGTKDMNFVMYTYPYRDKNTFTAEYFAAKRDSALRYNVPGPHDDIYMTLQDDLWEVEDGTVHGQYAQIARGLWKMANYSMGGPFVSVSRVDEKNGRVVVAEAFIFAPGEHKKYMMRRMEAALYTLRLPDELDVERFTYDIEEVTINPENQ